jgi:hypothetical protein
MFLEDGEVEYVHHTVVKEIFGGGGLDDGVPGLKDAEEIGSVD